AVLHHEQPAVSFRLLVRAGAAQDPPDKPGVATLVAALLDQGTTTRSAEQIATAIDSVGGALGTGAGVDLTFINAVVMKDSFDLALRLIADLARHPAFAPEEIERQRQQLLSALKVSYEDPEYLADVLFDRLVYGFHPYGRPGSGTPESVARITRDDLVAFHRAYFAPNNAILAIVGDVTAEEAFAGAARSFGDWPRLDGLTIPNPPDPPPPTRRIVVVDRPGAVQTEIRVGHLGVPRRHPDYLALDVAAKILGGEGSNRLHRVLRSERGLTYGASAELETRKYAGDLVAETDTRSEATAETLRLLVDEFWRLQREPVQDAELQGAKDYLTGSFPLTIETPSAIALQVLNALFYGLDLKELETFRERVNAVSVDDISRVARAYLRPDRLSIVLVGDASVFADKLPAAGFPAFERIPLTELDLTAADLRRPPARPAASERRPAAAALSSHDSHVEGAAADRARRILSAAIAAKGGLERLRAVRTLQASAVARLTGGDHPIAVETRTWIAYPDRFRIEATLPGGRAVEVLAGDDAWVTGPGAEEDGPAAAEARARADRDILSILLRAHEGSVAVRALPDETLDDGRTAHVLECDLPHAGRVALVIDAATGLVARLRYRAHAGGRPAAVEEMFSDYRAVDGVQVAARAVVRRDGRIVLERTLTAIAFDVPVDAALFRRPSS
ncbi:MAG TPA: pitrilysin family protein, partial [Vicinamibacterales bacterium]|nr:pitrilysin family protein [Vicinamibacterales bacterium]